MRTTDRERVTLTSIPVDCDTSTIFLPYVIDIFWTSRRNLLLWMMLCVIDLVKG